MVFEESKEVSEMQIWFFMPEKKVMGAAFSPSVYKPSRIGSRDGLEVLPAGPGCDHPKYPGPN